MNLSEIIRTALTALKGSILRTSLTMLGIIIGIVSGVCISYLTDANFQASVNGPFFKLAHNFNKSVKYINKAWINISVEKMQGDRYNIRATSTNSGNTVEFNNVHISTLPASLRYQVITWDDRVDKEVGGSTVEFKKIHYDIAEKLTLYASTSKYFLGLSDKKKDITVDENMLTHHLHVLGPTGSGKTSLVILPLAKQAIDKGRGACFIDFKGDEVFKKYVQEEAKEKGKKFYYFSIDPNEPSIGYNPLSSGDIHSKVDRIMAALELIYHGPAGFYSNVQAMAFVELLKEMTHDKKDINFSSVKDMLEDPHFLRRIEVSPQEVKGLLAAVSWISGLKLINNNELDLSEVIKDGDIVFFALKSQVNTRLAEAIGRMLIIDLKSQAVSRKETDRPYFVFIDEFQSLACSHFVDVISKVRSANFCLVLSNQSRGNLSSVSQAFENAIFTNTATKVIFMQEDPLDARFWSDKTGETTYQDKNIVQIITALRIFLPRLGITLSTRESASFRENLIALGITRMSAGSTTRVGGHTIDSKTGEDVAQFEISDSRSVDEIKTLLERMGYQAVFKDWMHL